MPLRRYSSAQFLSIEAALSRDLQPHVDSGEYDTLVCCGHSLGGALSTLAAPWYACRHPRLRVVADTFGSPLVGDARFAGWYGSTVPETARCWNQYDPVSRVPVGFGYTHVEHSVRFAGSATGQLGATAVGAGRVFSGGWRLLAVAAGMAQELGAEHHLTSYYSSLTSALASNQQTAVMQ